MLSQETTEAAQLSAPAAAAPFAERARHLAAAQAALAAHVAGVVIERASRVPA
jgi:hypothetical protein